MKKIIILSRSDSKHSDAIERVCNETGQVKRINFDFDNAKTLDFPTIHCGTEHSQFSDVSGIFIHHPRITFRKEGFRDELEEKLFVASWSSFKEWLEDEYPSAVWVNKPTATLKTKSVLAQLKLAKDIGFTVPRTVFTNDIDTLLRFAQDKKIVVKQGNLGVHAEGKRILTTEVIPSTIGKEALIGCPCFFQERVEKLFELRIHVIGDTVLTCRIDSQSSKKTTLDWRNYDLKNTPHSVYNTDERLNTKCIEIVKSLGLSFGVIDAIVTPTQEIVFLECNSQAHWLWIEKLTGLPVTKTICDMMVGPD